MLRYLITPAVLDWESKLASVCIEGYTKLNVIKVKEWNLFTWKLEPSYIDEYNHTKIPGELYICILTNKTIAISLSLFLLRINHITKRNYEPK